MSSAAFSRISTELHYHTNPSKTTSSSQEKIKTLLPFLKPGGNIFAHSSAPSICSIPSSVTHITISPLEKLAATIHIFHEVFGENFRDNLKLNFAITPNSQPTTYILSGITTINGTKYNFNIATCQHYQFEMISKQLTKKAEHYELSPELEITKGPISISITQPKLPEVKFFTSHSANDYSRVFTLAANVTYEIGIFNGKYYSAKHLEKQSLVLFSDGSRYNGPWKNGQPDCQETPTEPAGQVTTTTDVAAKQTKNLDPQRTQEIKIYVNGTIYSGDLYNGVPYGDGRKYHLNTLLDITGTWNNEHLLNGIGEGILSANGSLYNGTYLDNPKQPDLENWTLYSGDWKDNKPHGTGRLVDKHGDLISEGTWENGTFIELTQPTKGEAQKTEEVAILPTTRYHVAATLHSGSHETPESAPKWTVTRTRQSHRK